MNTSTKMCIGLLQVKYATVINIIVAKALFFTSFIFADMQKKILRVLATDFCCWVPISLMAFLSFSGVRISNDAYAVSAIILLPINSALNPILYSDAIELLVAWVRGKTLVKSLFSSVPNSTSTPPKTAFSRPTQKTMASISNSNADLALNKLEDEKTKEESKAFQNQEVSPVKSESNDLNL